ncbi:Alpha/Beta hydrolase protein [Truncatella angustata]|uniref:Alpha/Beta hydrolase protein n=1 Tax=Truncatella angustata TaxID=152316 RepID=A0A9P8ZY84_9PEZI|nr:Alpha/Beta hydrolase protein [Truncatella angustata]KAH6655776.1 Alpha/Beta hydrolase protein [Truncatella angustata]
MYAGASYCPVGKAGRPLFCTGDICPDNATTFATFSGAISDISGYIAINEYMSNIVIAVRGSSDLHNWITNLRFLQTGCYWGSDCRVHEGFQQAYQDILNDNFYESLRQAIEDYPSYNITVTGHSLGGAVATLLGVYAREEFPDVGAIDIYTYGSPRVGNLPLLTYVHNQPGGREYRLTHFDDVFPRLPPMSYLGYAHSSAEYWLKWGPADRVDYVPGMIAKCWGFLNGDCNAAGWYPGLRSHLYYLVAISHCGGARSRLSFGGLPIDDAPTWNATVMDKDTIERLEMFAEMDQQYAAAMSTISDPEYA